MSRARAALALGLALAALGALPAAAQGPDPFFSELERDGRAALARGESAEAARLLRIACFGLLEAPDRLGACLVRLGLAQQGAGDGAAFDQTFRRLQTVEERFGVWDRLAIDPEERAAFGRIAGERIPATLLRSQAAFAPFAPAPATGKSARGARSEERAKASAKPAPPATPEPRPEPRPEPKRESAPVPPPPAPEPPRGAPAPEVVSAPAGPPEWTAAEREALVRVRPLMTAPAGIDALESALADVRPIAERHPEDVDAQRTLAVLAYRASHWDLCAAAFRRSGLPPAEQPLIRFYMAVCLYETGDRTAAAEAVRDSTPQLARTPFVDRYLRAILGSGAAKP